MGQNFSVMELEEEREQFHDHGVSQPYPVCAAGAPGTTHAV